MSCKCGREKGDFVKATIGHLGLNGGSTFYWQVSAYLFGVYFAKKYLIFYRVQLKQALNSIKQHVLDPKIKTTAA